MYKARKPRSKHEIPENIKRLKTERQVQRKDLNLMGEEEQMEEGTTMTQQTT